MKRKNDIDILRGICIIYMIMGHVNFGEYFDHYIHAFHMPVFFFCSGLFFRRNNSLSFSDYLKKISKQILVPYLIWGFFFFLFTSLTKVELKLSYLETFLKIFTINSSGFPIAGALWFLTCFFFSQIIVYLLNKFCKKDYLFGILSILFMVFGIYFTRIFDFRLWLSADVSFVGVGLIYFGYIFSKHKILEKLCNLNFICTIGLFVINVYLIMKTGYVNMRLGTYPNVLFFILNVILSIISYLNIIRIILNIPMLKFISDIIAYIGKNSIVSLCLNQFIIILIYKIFNTYNISSYFNNLYIYKLLISTLTIGVIYILSKFTLNSKLKILFGK